MLLRNTLDSSHSFHSSPAFRVVTTATTLAQFHHNNRRMTLLLQLTLNQNVYMRQYSTYNTMIVDVDNNI